MSLENYTAQEIADLAALADQLASNPATRKEMLRLTKKISPNTPIPEIDVEHQISSFAKPYVEKINGLESQLSEMRLKDSILSKQSELKKKGFSDEEISEVQKLMVEKQIPNYETAADFFRMQKQTATPTPSTMTPISLPANAMSAGKLGLNRWAQGEAFSAINDLRQGKVAAA